VYANEWGDEVVVVVVVVVRTTDVGRGARGRVAPAPEGGTYLDIGRVRRVKLRPTLSIGSFVRHFYLNGSVIHHALT
jgi:hypothetical protein